MDKFVEDSDFTLYHGNAIDVMSQLPKESIDCVITSPPYYALRDYGEEGQIGLERTPVEYVQNIVTVFREVHRLLKPEGTVWLNLGDTYAGSNKGSGGTGSSGLGSAVWGNGMDDAGVLRTQMRQSMEIHRIETGLKPKNLIGIPWRVAFALQDFGWILRSDIIWAKRNPMPSSVTDRPSPAHEYIFFLTKNVNYYFDQDAVREPHASDSLQRMLNPRHKYGSGSGDSERSKQAVGTHPDGRNIRSVWELSSQPLSDEHYAVYPEELVRRCLLAGCPVSGTVLDPFIGSGTTALVARKHNRKAIGIELKEEYCQIAARRLQQLSLFS